MAGTPRTNALGEYVLDLRTGEPIVDRDLTNCNRALVSLAKISGLHVPPTEAFENVVFTLTLDRDLSEEGE